MCRGPRGEGLQAFHVESLKARGSILWWVSCNNAEGLSTPPTVHGGLVASMVPGIPAVGAPRAGTADGEVTSWRTRHVACIVTAALHWWCHTVNSSIMDWLWDRVALPGVVVPNLTRKDLNTCCLLVVFDAGSKYFVRMKAFTAAQSKRNQNRHVPIVLDNTGWTRDHLPAAILLLPLHLGVTSWLAVGRHHIDEFPVPPNCGNQTTLLAVDVLSSLQISFIHTGTCTYRE